jgi:hypothetical protein
MLALGAALGGYHLWGYVGPCGFSSEGPCGSQIIDSARQPALAWFGVAAVLLLFAITIMLTVLVTRVVFASRPQ